jgi:hypothetical protein
MFSALFRAVLGASFLAVALSAGAWADGQPSQVEGRIGLVQRMTFVPYFCDQNVSCPHSQPYWVMTVTGNNGVYYEFDSPFGLGDAACPQSIEFSGVILHSGTDVVLEGNTEMVNPTYGLITSVSWIRVVQ